MTKQEYIKLRQNNDIILIWIYYIKQCEERKIKQLMNTPQALIQNLQLWGFHKGENVGEIFKNVIQYYDNKFTITQLFDEEQQLITIL